MSNSKNVQQSQNDEIRTWLVVIVILFVFATLMAIFGPRLKRAQPIMTIPAATNAQKAVTVEEVEAENLEKATVEPVADPVVQDVPKRVSVEFSFQPTINKE